MNVKSLRYSFGFSCATLLSIVALLPLFVSAGSIVPDSMPAVQETVPAIPLTPGGVGTTEVERLVQQLRIQVAALVMQIQTIQAAQASIGQVKGASTTSCPVFSRTLRFGMHGDDVLALQQFLFDRGFLTHEDATSYYGYLTEAAVQSFQRIQKIVDGGDPQMTGYGVAGSQTRSVVTRVCSTGQ